MAPVQRKKIGINLVIPFAIVALVFGGLVWKKMQASREPRPVPKLNEPASVRKAVLFFVADGSRLAREAREMEPCGDLNDCVKSVLDELFSGPVGDLDEALPEGAALKSLRVEGDTAIVDLNQSFADELPAGSSAEMMAVYSIVDTICVNFPKITKVKLTVEGNEHAALRHLDLSDPLAPDYTLEQVSPPATDKGAATPSAPAKKKGHS